MKRFGRVGTAVAVAVMMVVAVGLTGCGDDNGVNSGGGGSIVGDWLQISTTTPDGITTIIEDSYPNSRVVLSYKSSGDVQIHSFGKNNSGDWSETILSELYETLNISVRQTWRTVGSTLHTTTVTEGSGIRIEASATSTYTVSNDKLTFKTTSSIIDGIEQQELVGNSSTYKKIDLASYRRSLGL